MHQTYAKRQKNVKRGKVSRPMGHVPIEFQVQQAAQASAHRNDKRNTRNKQNNWRKEHGV